jgi:hypothetical protein
MAIDASIALGVKPVQIESPINQMAKMYEMQNAVQSNQLNRMKMDEYTRGVAEAEQFKNALAQSNDETAIRNAFYAKGDVKGYNDYLKSVAEQKKLDIEATNLGYTGQKTQVEAADKKQSMMQSMMRDLSTRPSDANIMAYAEDVEASPLFSPQEKAAVKRRTQVLLTLPVDQRVPELASQGASAGELKPTIQTQNLNDRSVVSSYPAFGGAPTQLSSTPMGISPEAQLSAATQRRGQDITARGQDLTNKRELERIANEKGRNSPEYIRAEAKAKEQGKQAAIFEATAPQAIVKAEEAMRKIDELIGDTTIDRKGKLQYGKVKPHPGFSVSVGASAQPGFQYLSGTDKADFYARIEEIQGQAFMQAFETLKGGGAITETEGIKGTKAITRMSTAQSEPEFIRAATEFKSIVRKGLENAKTKLAPATGDVDTNNPLLN